MTDYNQYMGKIFIDWDSFQKECYQTASKIIQSNVEINTIIALSRGGLVPGRIIAEYVNPNNFYTIGLKLYEDGKRGEEVVVYQDMPENTEWSKLGNILVVDDVSDGGTTLDFVYSKLQNHVPKETIFTATPYIKKETKFVPNYYSSSLSQDLWIVFPFEKD